MKLNLKCALFPTIQIVERAVVSEWLLCIKVSDTLLNGAYHGFVSNAVFRVYSDLIFNKYLNWYSMCPNHSGQTLMQNFRAYMPI